MWLKIVLGICLFVFFFSLFLWLGFGRVIKKIMHRTLETVDAAARQRMHESRKLLLLPQERKGILYRAEQRLVYSGLTVRYGFLTPELWILFNLVVSAAGYFMVLICTGRFDAALLVLAVLQVLRHLLESILMAKNYRSVNENLIKFLDFLGNYSITAGEVTGILNQISRYLDEPLKTVLDECYYEAQTSGDVSLALLSMAEKIEHPRFKELVRNLEISVRYSADLTTLVNNSRRSMREHMRTRQERKALVNEALINMLILAVMSVVILLTVEQLIGTSIQQILLHSLPGRACLSVIGIIFMLLYLQVRKLDR